MSFEINPSTGILLFIASVIFIMMASDFLHNNGVQSFRDLIRYIKNKLTEMRRQK